MKRVILVILATFLTLPAQEGIGIGEDIDKILFEGLNTFKLRLSFKESSGNPLSESESGYYRGLYHFGKSAAADVGVSYDSLFISRWSDTALVRYMRINKSYLKGYTEYIGDTISGVKVTEAGILAAAHLKGHVWVKRWLKSGGRVNGKDALGTSVRDYMAIMEDVKLMKY